MRYSDLANEYGKLAKQYSIERVGRFVVSSKRYFRSWVRRTPKGHLHPVDEGEEDAEGAWFEGGKGSTSSNIGVEKETSTAGKEKVCSVIAMDDVEDRDGDESNKYTTPSTDNDWTEAKAMKWNGSDLLGLCKRGGRIVSEKKGHGTSSSGVYNELYKGGREYLEARESDQRGEKERVASERGTKEMQQHGFGSLGEVEFVDIDWDVDIKEEEVVSLYCEAEMV